jgi:hypothetical protein
MILSVGSGLPPSSSGLRPSFAGGFVVTQMLSRHVRRLLHACMSSAMDRLSCISLFVLSSASDVKSMRVRSTVVLPGVAVGTVDINGARLQCSEGFRWGIVGLGLLVVDWRGSGLLVFECRGSVWPMSLLRGTDACCSLLSLLGKCFQSCWGSAVSTLFWNRRPGRSRFECT